MDPMINSVEYNGVDEHGWKKVVSRKRVRKQKPEDQAANGNLANNDKSNCAAANENLDYSEEQAGDVVDESNLKAEEEEKPDWKLSLAKAAAKIGPSDLADFLDRVPLARFLDYYEVALAGVPCPWRQMLQESDLPNLFDVLHVPLSYIPEPVYKTSIYWLDQLVPSTELRCDFVLLSFNYILCDLYIQRGGVFHDEAMHLGYAKPGDPCVSEVSIFVTLAMLVRSDPLVLTRVLPSLWVKRYFHGPGRIPLTIWLVDQASQDNLPVGLYSWVHSLLPLVPRIPESTDPILKLVEKILAKPDAQTILVNAPVWDGRRLIPPHIFEALLWLTFPVTSEREEATSRFEAIYPLLKEVALASTSGNEAIKQIFTFSLKLSGEEGNPALVKEATAIAIRSLTEIVDCWKHWESIYKENLKESLTLLKKLLGKCKDSTLGSKAMIQQIFTFSLKLAGEGNPVLPQQATAIAIWSLTKIFDYWKHWDNLYEENLKACVDLLKKLVEKCEAHFLKLSPSPSKCTLTGSPGSKAMKQVTQKIFTLSLKLAKEVTGNPVLAKEATSIAIWSLTENINCWKHWENLYKENLEVSVALLKKLVDEWKGHSLKLLSPPSDTLTLSQTIKSFMLKNKKAITEREAKASLYKEADESCKVISGRLPRGSISLKGTTITVVVLVATVVLAAGAHGLSYNP
ncbi:uncharacterized protein LOC9312951 isoform X3 [Arabidopsis lyrata subsp. lyrata]|uniref:uncharacterized protein LOC9312951 isoform X3 n=1 Tax=Arabidopsis lyrata subsp. lyrata TaxID=81972 RepID=UPI000A29D1A7|nr:uncharacterized protein LOC9312951 isoform X3 [Arabidopsis lyrata subsp. lyrata]|eukprot:XP_020881604.1 uncharacterized protein LOC9312951 isoform X3 [Arabidopsis lyrata subsp. lyrata]